MKISKFILNTFLLSILMASGIQADASERDEKLTEEQRQCLVQLLGERGSGERPSREQFEEALRRCGIKK